MIKVTAIKPFGGDFRVTSPFGERIDPITGEKKNHNGIDFACPEGTPIRAVLGGKIFKAGWENDADHSQGYGQRVWVESTFNDMDVQVVYAHLSSINKKVDDPVDQGGIIGLSGNTGKSTGPHLHVGVRIKYTNTYMDFDFEGEAV